MFSHAPPAPHSHSLNTPDFVLFLHVAVKRTATCRNTSTERGQEHEQEKRGRRGGGRERGTEGREGESKRMKEIQKEGLRGMREGEREGAESLVCSGFRTI